MRSKLVRLVLLAVVALCAANSWAGSITVLNPSFELPALVGPGPANGVPASWVVGGAAGVHLPGVGEFNPGFPTDGVQAGYANAGGSLSQVLADVLTVGTYQLTVDIGRRMDFPADVSGQSVQLYAGATLLATAPVVAPAAGNWLPATLSYVNDHSDPNLGQPLKIVLGSGTTQTDFDNVRLTEIPEPAAIGLVAFGFMGLIARRRRSVIAR